MGKFDLLNEIRSASTRSDTEITNHEALGISPEVRGVRIAWMYPDVLNMHGGRGDAMALLHFSNLMQLPCTIRKVRRLTDAIPFDWADMLFFPSGDLASMEDICRVLVPQRDAFRKFADAGKVILATGSSGALLAEGTRRLDGTKFPGLGLLKMQFKQRERVYGNDLWITLPNGMELLGPQIQMADVHLRPEQEPLGKVRYGRGNRDKGDEGARTNNVIFTHVLGPLLVKNPLFTAELLRLAAVSAGIDIQAGSHSSADSAAGSGANASGASNPGASASALLSEEDIRLETESLEDLKTFIKKKEDGVITW